MVHQVTLASHPSTDLDLVAENLESATLLAEGVGGPQAGCRLGTGSAGSFWAVVVTPPGVSMGVLTEGVAPSVGG
jgi:hypothetical protein